MTPIKPRVMKIVRKFITNMQKEFFLQLLRKKKSRKSHRISPLFFYFLILTYSDINTENRKNKKRRIDKNLKFFLRSINIC